MSISVCIGHSGQRLTLDPSVTNTVEALRTCISTQASIPPRSQILLTAQGKQVRTQTLLTENELFVFDSSWLNGKKAAGTPSDPADASAGIDFDPGPVPDTLTNQNEFSAWHDLFRSRKSWAANLLAGCRTLAQRAEKFQDEQAVIERGLKVAVASLQQHIRSAEKQYAQAESVSHELMHEQQAHVDSWEANFDSLRSVPARAEFSAFIPPMSSSSSTRRLSQQTNIATLQGFVDVITVRQAAGSAKSVLTAFSQKVSRMHEDLQNASKQSGDLLYAVEGLESKQLGESNSEPVQLVTEIELVVKKMASDLEHVQSLPRIPQYLPQASKMALLHTRNYLPNLSDYCAEMNELLHRAKQQRDATSDTALEHMRTLSAIESQLAKLYQEIKELEVHEEHQQSFSTLSVISRIPSVYGQLMVESVRRREWVAKMKRDSSTLQEEVAAYQEEEDKRRKKWIRTVEDIVSPEALQTRVLGIELSLQNEGGGWPVVSREEVNEYYKTLLGVYGQGPVTDEINQAIKDLDKPTRRQMKHARAFKNGSIHEAAFGETSLLLRGDDQNRSLRETNARLEEELRAKKSQVRRLEDLLHRQTQISRLSTGDVFTPQSELSHPTSPGGLSSQISRAGSMSQQRKQPFPAAPSADDKRLAKRIVDLEAELQSHKDQANLRKNSDAEAQKQVEEAVSIKKDLMENMEAQQREFAIERRTLEKELAEAKEKVEEADNEIERLMGSRDGVDEEIVRLKEDAAGHAARAATEHDARTAIERRLEKAEAARMAAEENFEALRNEVKTQEESDAEHLITLATAHNHLSREGSAPGTLASLAPGLEELARKSRVHVKDLEEAVAFARSENESLSYSNEKQKVELSQAGDKHAELEEALRQAQEKQAAEHAKVESLEQLLSEEQEQLRSLRGKFAEGETGSEVLRQRVTEAEAKTRRLSSELAEANSHINSLDVELLRMQRSQQAHSESAGTHIDRLDRRAEHAKEVSQKLVSHNARLGRLLERLGLVITYQDDVMVIERASKMNASTNVSELQHQLQRVVSLSSPPPTRKPSSADAEPPTDLKLFRWPEAHTAEDEAAQFEAFLNHVARFDLDVFSDAVTKRVKDFEYTAKKYSKEAKESTKRADAYKERALKLRSEAQTKITVREFKEGDLALFLPTRGGQVKGAWAAFNIGCPHYFLAEKESMRLNTRDFLVARIHKVEQKVVDLSGQRAAVSHLTADGRSIDSDAPSSMAVEDENPFDLSDGLTWWLVHVVEERGGGAAPTTPGLGKSTVAAANVDAKGSIRIKRSSKSDDASKHLNKSLDSRRSSNASNKKGLTILPGSAATHSSPAIASPTFAANSIADLAQSRSTNHPLMSATRPATNPSPGTAPGSNESLQQQREQHDQVRKDLL